MPQFIRSFSCSFFLIGCLIGATAGLLSIHATVALAVVFLASVQLLLLWYLYHNDDD
jgi:hypothetical protein